MTQTSPLIGKPLGPMMFRMAVPGVIGAILFSCFAIVEAAWLRRIGTDALAAVAMVFPLLMLAAMFSQGAIGGAVAGSIARALGAGDQERARSILMCAIVIAIVGGALMYLLILWLGPWLYQRTTSNPLVAVAAEQYAAIVFAAMPAFWLIGMLSSVLRGSGDMVRPAIVAAVLVLSYAGFAAVFLTDTELTLDSAMRRAGWALVLSFVTASIAAICFIVQPTQPVQLKFSSLRLSTMSAILRQGLIASSQSFMTFGYALVTTVLFSRFGTDWLAGYGLAVRLELFMVPVIFGIGASLIAIVGAHVGAGLRREAISIAWKGVFINTAIMGIIGVFFAVYPGLWCTFLGSDDNVIANCSQSLRFVAPTFAFFALGLGSYFASQGLNTLGYPVIGAFIRLAVVATGLLWITDSTPVIYALSLVVLAVVLYGLTVAVGLKLGPWATRR